MFDMDVLLGDRRSLGIEWWQGDRGSLWVSLDEQGRVRTKGFIPGRLNFPTFLQRFRHALHLANIPLNRAYGRRNGIVPARVVFGSSRGCGC